MSILVLVFVINLIILYSVYVTLSCLQFLAVLLKNSSYESVINITFLFFVVLVFLCVCVSSRDFVVFVLCLLYNWMAIELLNWCVNI